MFPLLPNPQRPEELRTFSQRKGFCSCTSIAAATNRHRRIKSFRDELVQPVAADRYLHRKQALANKLSGILRLWNCKKVMSRKDLSNGNWVWHKDGIPKGKIDVLLLVQRQLNRKRNQPNFMALSAQESASSSMKKKAS